MDIKGVVAEIQKDKATPLVPKVYEANSFYIFSCSGTDMKWSFNKRNEVSKWFRWMNMRFMKGFLDILILLLEKGNNDEIS